MLVFLAAILSSGDVYGRCSDYADGFVFAFRTSIMSLNPAGQWQESGRVFASAYSYTVEGVVDHDGPDRLLYVRYFEPGDRDCERAVVKANQVYRFGEAHYVLRCAREIDGFIIGNRTVPLWRSELGQWRPFANRIYSGDFAFEVIDTITQTDDQDILILLMNTRSDYRCMFGAVYKDQVVLLQHSEDT